VATLLKINPQVFVVTASSYSLLVEQDIKIGLSSGVFYVGFKMGLQNKIHWVFWECARVSEPWFAFHVSCVINRRIITLWKKLKSFSELIIVI